ncbi:MAG: hypothetical protein ABI767_03055 [Rhodanobacter sp.]
MRIKIITKGRWVNHFADAAAEKNRIQDHGRRQNRNRQQEKLAARHHPYRARNSVQFDLGRPFHCDPSMQTHAAAVVNLRSW